MGRDPSKSLAVWLSLRGCPGLLVAALVAGCPHAGAVVDPKRSANRLELAKDYLGRGLLEQAEVEAKASLDYDDDNVEAENVLGLIDFFRARRDYNLLEEQDCVTGGDAEALRAELDDYLSHADRHFERAVEMKPEFGEGWANRGSVQLLLDQFAPATRYLDRALAFPQSLLNIGVTRANLGWAYFHQKDYARAAKELRQAEQFNPGMCVAKYRLGRVYFARAEWKRALEQFQAVAQDPACPMQEAHLYLLQTYAQLGMTEEAPPARQRCIEMAPRSCIAARCRAL
jgi:tetratricopeptide (TPR) repeat protein